MAKKISFIEVVLKASLDGALPHESLDLSSAKMRYSVADDVDPEMTKGVADVTVTPIIGSDSMTVWFAKVATQIKQLENIP